MQLYSGTSRQFIHQPFQEVPDEFNARVKAFWREVEAGG
jgi:hypothetical protein